MRRAVAFSLLFLQAARAIGGTVLVLYPDAPPPYRLAFEQMIAGIERLAGRPVRTRALSDPDDPAAVARWIDTHRDNGALLVLLGHRAVAMSAMLATGLPVLVGGITSMPDQVKAPGVSLTIDPALFLATVHDLLPATKTVVVVYNAHYQGLVPRLEHAALAQGLTIQSLAVADAASAVEQLSRTFATIDPHTTALWFTQDTLSLNSELIFPFVLEETWARGIPAFSETVAHTKRGLLFSLYPDYHGIGMELGERIGKATGAPPEFTLTRAARLAVNLRTARHLGLSPRAEVMEKAAVLFPEP